MLQLNDIYYFNLKVPIDLIFKIVCEKGYLSNENTMSIWAGGVNIPGIINTTVTNLVNVVYEINTSEKNSSLLISVF